MKKGTYEFKLEEGIAGFRYDMHAGELLEEMEGKYISEILSDLIVIAQQAKEGNLQMRLSLLMNVLCSGANAYAEYNGIDAPRRSTVSDWANEIEADDLYKMIFEGMQMFIPKNSKAPLAGANSKQTAPV